MTVTNALCGEHGAPIFTLREGREISCIHGCDLVWSDLREEVGSVVERHEGFVVVVDLEEPSHLGESRGYSHAAYAVAYGVPLREEPTTDDLPSYVLHHFSDAVRTAYEQGWERGVVEAQADHDAL